MAANLNIDLQRKSITALIIDPTPTLRPAANGGNDLDYSGLKGVNAADGVDPTDLVTKQQLDTAVAGAGATDLTVTAAPTKVTVNSSTGTDADINAVDNTNSGVMLPAQKTKLDGIEAAATANATNAYLLDRANHTGIQNINTLGQSGATTGQIAKWDGTNWVPATPTSGGIAEAPNDGNTYGRKSLAWQAINPPEYLTANRTVYVATTGSNTTGDGTSGTPWATVQFALNKLTSIHLNGYNYVVKIKAGTYSTNTLSTYGVTPLGYGAQGRVFIESENIANTSDVVIARTSNDTGTPSHFNISCPNYTVRYMTLSTTSTLSCNAILFTNGATNCRAGFIKFSGNGGTSTFVCLYLGGASVDVYAAFGPAVELIGNMELTGTGIRNFINSTTHANLVSYFSGAITITFSGTTTMYIFIELNGFTFVNLYNVAYSGTFTGKKYGVNFNSICANAGNPPGSTAGTTSYQGQYI